MRTEAFIVFGFLNLKNANYGKNYDTTFNYKVNVPRKLKNNHVRIFW